MSSPIREALEQVRLLQQSVLEHQRFHGYSGSTRILSGIAALVAAVIMSMDAFPKTNKAHIMGWGAVFVFSLLANGAAIIYWFLNDKRVHREVRRLRPLIDALLPLFIGGVLTAGLVLAHQFNLLFGVWMCMFGLCNLASRHVLPWWMGFVGLFYVVCGSAWILAPGTEFLHPWPMGLVFFAGEWAGGMILHFDDYRNLTLRESLRKPHFYSDAEKGNEHE